MGAVPETQHPELISVAHALADAAAAAVMPYFRADRLSTENKAADGRFDPVTEADRAAEAAMRTVLAERRPDDAVMGEEEAPRRGTSGLTWVLDPIDGTRAFMSGLPVWGTLIGLDAGQGPVLGMISQPYVGERFIGGLGQCALQRDGAPARPLRTRACADLAHATLFTTFPEIGSVAERQGFAEISRRARLTRYGTDCYAYALLALGQIDLVIEAGLHSYDIQGPQAVVEAAGGRVTSWDGGPAHHGGRILASGDPALHEVVLEILSRVE